MPRESYRDVHVDRALSNFSVACWQNTADFVAGKIFPAINVQHASDEFDYFPSGFWNRIHESRRAEEGVANQIGYGVSKKHYSCGENALRVFISDRKRANADSNRNLDLEATELVVRALLLGKEKEFVDRFLTPGVWGRDMSGVASSATSTTNDNFTQWDDASSDPVKLIGDLQVDMLLRGKRKPNTLLMTLDVWNALRNHPDFMGRVKYTGSIDNPARVTERTVGALFDVERIFIMQTVVNMALETVEDMEGKPATDDQFLAANTIWLGYVSPSNGLMSPTAAMQFFHNRYINQGANGGPAIRRYRETPAKKGEYIEGEMSMDQRVCAPDLGILMTNVISTPSAAGGDGGEDGGDEGEGD